MRFHKRFVARLRNPLFAATFTLTAAQSGLGGSALIWDNASGGDFNTAGNWNPDQAPIAGDTLTINIATAGSIAASTASAATSLTISGSGAPTLNFGANTLTLSGNFTVNSSGALNGGGVSAAGLIVGFPAMSASFTMDGSSTNLTMTSGQVGRTSSATPGSSNSFTIQNGADFVSNTNFFSIGFANSAAAANGNTITVTGAGSTWIANGGIFVGNLANGTAGAQANNNALVIDNSGSLITSQLWIGRRSTGTLTSATGNSVTVGGSGSASSLTSTGLIQIGQVAGNNTLNVISGGTVTATSADTTIGGFAGNALNVVGGTYDASGRTISVGSTAKMKLDGGSVTAGTLSVSGVFGNNADAASKFTKGTLNVTTLTSSPTGYNFAIGNSDGGETATLNITGSGTHIFGLGMLIQNDGILAGSGNVKLGSGAIIYNSGVIAPGTPTGAPGSISVDGNVLFRPGSTLKADVIGTAQDELAVGGLLDLSQGNATVAVDFRGTIPASARYVLTRGASISGTFANLVITNYPGALGWKLDYSLPGEVALVSSPREGAADSWSRAAAERDLGTYYVTPVSPFSYTLHQPSGTYTMPWTRLAAQNLAWGESYLLETYLTLYQSWQDTAWLEKLVQHFDSISTAQTLIDHDGDGRRGWATTYYARNRVEHGGFNQPYVGFWEYPSYPKNWTRYRNGTEVNHWGDNTYAYRSTASGDFVSEGNAEFLYGVNTIIDEQAGLVIKTGAGADVWSMKTILSGHTPGLPYEVTFQGRTDSTTGIVKVLNSTAGTTIAEYRFTTGGAWATQRFAFTPPAAGTTLAVELSITGGGGQARFDAVKVEAVCEYPVHEGMILKPIADFITLVRADAALAATGIPGSNPHTTYGQKADAYLELLRTNFLTKWDATWREIGNDAGCFTIATDDHLTSAGYWAGASLPLNQNNSFQRLLMAIYPSLPSTTQAEIDAKNAVLNKILRLAQYSRARYADNPSSPPSWLWNYSDKLFSPQDDARVVVPDDTSHANIGVIANAEFRRIKPLLPGPPSSLFGDSELNKQASTLMNVMYSATNAQASPFGWNVATSDPGSYPQYSRFTWGWLELCEQNPSIYTPCENVYLDPGVVAEANLAVNVLTMAKLSNWNPRRVWNRGFEYAADATPSLPRGWTRFQDPGGIYCYRSTSPVDVRTGKAAMVVKSGSNQWHTMDQTVSGLIPGANYILSFSGKYQGTANSGVLRVNAVVGGATTYLNMKVFTNTEWQRMTVPFTAPSSGTVQVRCYYGDYTKDGTTVWFDDINIGEAPPTVSVTATGPVASEYSPSGPVAGTFTVSRTGPTSDPLTINFQLGGSALQGIDYLSPGTSVVIPAGASSIPITISPLADTLAEGMETVSIFLLATISAGTADYLINPSTVIVNIDDKPYDAWRFTKFGIHSDNPDIAGETADPDADGLLNLLEYAIGSNPNAPSGQADLPHLSLENGIISLTYQRDVSTIKSDIQYKVQKSATMNQGTWSRVDVDTSAIDGIALGTHEIISTNGTIETWRGSVPAGNSSAIFLRLKIMPPE